MTDTQLLTLALALIIPLSMLIYSNTRITEAKETLRAEMAEMRVEMRAGFARIETAIGQLRTDLHAEIQLLRTDLERHETLKRH